ncbi:MAG: acyltransferase [Betaproteobacteria bacterium]|nr:acyltransferase [Betaproteobacteria bacterium]
MRVSLRLAGAIGKATLTRWRKRPGEAFKKGEALYDIENEKSMVEVEAPCDGIMIEPLVAEGDDVEVGQFVCIIDQA